MEIGIDEDNNKITKAWPYFHLQRMIMKIKCEKHSDN